MNEGPGFRDLVQPSFSFIGSILFRYIADYKLFLIILAVIRQAREQFMIILFCSFHLRDGSCVWMGHCIADTRMSVSLLVNVMILAVWFIPGLSYYYSIGCLYLISSLEIDMSSASWYVCYYAICCFFPF